MAKHRIGAEWKQPPKVSYLPQSPDEIPEMMILDESETLLGEQYAAAILMNSTEKFLSPSACATIVEMGGVAASPAHLSGPIRKQLTASPMKIPRMKVTAASSSNLFAAIPNNATMTDRAISPSQLSKGKLD